MKSNPASDCPFCGGRHIKIFRDRLGPVAWCQHCLRTWVGGADEAVLAEGRTLEGVDRNRNEAVG